MGKTWAGAIRSADDARRLLADVNQRGLERATTTALAAAVQPADDVDLVPDTTRLLPAPDELAPLFPWPGLRRGATVAVTGCTSVLLTLLAAAMRDGSWAAIVGMPQLGLLAAGQDHQVPLDRLALVPQPGPDWPTVVAALLDGVDVVVVAAPAGVSEATVRSLQARARQRGAVLIPTTAWPGADVVIETVDRRWFGLGSGSGRLRRQELQLRSTGRGKAARPRTASVSLPLGVTDQQWVIPPAPGVEDEPTRPESPLWARVEPNYPPRDVWADLQDAIPAAGSKRR